jgi:hypothetical protein
MPISVKPIETVERDSQQLEQKTYATWFVYKNHRFVLCQTDRKAYEPDPINPWLGSNESAGRAANSNEALYSARWQRPRVWLGIVKFPLPSG